MNTSNLIIINYDKDTERKRIDYLIERWSDRGDIEKIKKMVIIADVENINEFVKDIMSRLEGDVDNKIKVYEIEEVKKTILPKKVILCYEITDKKKALDGFLKYLLIKIGASYEYSVNDIKKYEVYTKKGNCSISIKLNEKEENVLMIVFEIEGYGESMNLIKNKIDSDMKLFIEGLL
ncbi:MAG: hypothetical protein HF967_00585 [Methanosarcinales archaeon]|nr:hypothetical protein [Methanosarcinales archaeon]